jgi:hypothetical protein
MNRFFPAALAVLCPVVSSNAAAAGTLVKAMQIQELRELAR